MNIFVWIGIACVLCILSGFASAYAGAHKTSKNWRRILIPALSAAFAMIYLRSLWMIFLMARAGALSMGYGVPTPDDPEPSMLGAFWYDILDGDHEQTAIAVRGTIGIMKMCTLLPIPIITHHWILWIIAGLIITANNLWWGALVDNEGMFWIGKKHCLFEELLIEFIDAICIYGLVILCR